ncbi:MAG: hypothetical protein HFI33_08555 [Lachnospiraceae bacterium]|nr:hypothetical protein [Lachnospiraceae bacterium]
MENFLSEDLPKETRGNAVPDMDPCLEWESTCFASPYVEALCSFIRECDPPIFLAIQGGARSWDWKSHLLGGVKQLEKEGIRCIWLDTSSYGKYTGQGEDMPDFSQRGLTKGFWDSLAAEKREGDARLLFVVDGLDELLPVVVVKLLEFLKESVSYEKCVTLLSVDREVVFQGIREKYGNCVSDREAKRQYDRLIQLTFQLPKAYYQEQIAKQFSVRSFYDREWYLKAVYLLTEGSFRDVKRLYQAFLLMDKVAQRRGIYGKGEQEREKQKKCMFLLSGIQLFYPEMYDHITFSVSFDFIKRLINKENRTHMRCVLGDLHFPQSEAWTGWFLDVMILFGSFLEEYIGSGQNLEDPSFLRVEDVCRMVRLDRGEVYIQPESDRNFREGKEGETAEICTLQEMYLFHKMDQVFSSYFHKKDQSPWDRRHLECRYYKRGTSSWNWLFGIRFTKNAVFPTAYFREELFWEELFQEGHFEHGELLRLQKDLSFWYGKLQEEYGKRSYGDKDFTGNEFLIYSEQQANLFMEGILRIFAVDDIFGDPLHSGDEEIEDLEELFRDADF